MIVEETLEALMDEECIPVVIENESEYMYRHFDTGASVCMVEDYRGTPVYNRTLETYSDHPEIRFVTPFKIKNNVIYAELLTYDAALTILFGKYHSSMKKKKAPADYAAEIGRIQTSLADKAMLIKDEEKKMAMMEAELRSMEARLRKEKSKLGKYKNEYKGLMREKESIMMQLKDDDPVNAQKEEERKRKKYYYERLISLAGAAEYLPREDQGPLQM